MHHSQTPSEALLRAVAQDLKPVRSSPEPLQLALRMAAPALVISSLILWGSGPRRDLGLLGPLLAWGASAVQFALAIAFVWIAAHESLPVGRLPRPLLRGAMVTASLVVILVSLATFWQSPSGATLVRVPPVVSEMLHTSPWLMGMGCWVGSTAAGVVLILSFSWIFRNSLATRATEAGALYGAAAGLAVNAGWRIACPVSTPWHSLGAHGAAIIATVIFGALIGRFLGRRRLYTATRV